MLSNLVVSSLPTILLLHCLLPTRSRSHRCPGESIHFSHGHIYPTFLAGLQHRDEETNNTGIINKQKRNIGQWNANYHWKTWTEKTWMV